MGTNVCDLWLQLPGCGRTGPVAQMAAVTGKLQGQETVLSTLRPLRRPAWDQGFGEHLNPDSGLSAGTMLTGHPVLAILFSMPVTGMPPPDSCGPSG